MGFDASSGEWYDLLYSEHKDYPAEAALLASIIRDHSPSARTILDVACGTGQHARFLTDQGFEVDGVDLVPELVEIAAQRCPSGRFHVADMRAFHLKGRYDVVTCLFSGIAYAHGTERLQSAISCMAEHLKPGGLLIVDPWFGPGDLTNGWISTQTGGDEKRSVARMSRTVIDGRVSRLEFEFIFGSASGLRRGSNTHELYLFTPSEMEQALLAAGLTVSRRPFELGFRGLYLAGRETT